MTALYKYLVLEKGEDKMVRVIGGTHQTPSTHTLPVMLLAPRTTVPDCAAAKHQIRRHYVAFIVLRSSIFPNK